MILLFIQSLCTRVEACKRQAQWRVPGKQYNPQCDVDPTSAELRVKRSTNFHKGPESKYFKICGSYRPCQNSQLCCSGEEASPS